MSTECTEKKTQIADCAESLVSTVSRMAEDLGIEVDEIRSSVYPVHTVIDIRLMDEAGPTCFESITVPVLQEWHAELLEWSEKALELPEILQAVGHTGVIVNTVGAAVQVIRDLCEEIFRFKERGGFWGDAHWLLIGDTGRIDSLGRRATPNPVHTQEYVRNYKYCADMEDHQVFLHADLLTPQELLDRLVAWRKQKEASLPEDALEILKIVGGSAVFRLQASSKKNIMKTVERLRRYAGVDLNSTDDVWIAISRTGRVTAHSAEFLGSADEVRKTVLDGDRKAVHLSTAWFLSLVDAYEAGKEPEADSAEPYQLNGRVISCVQITAGLFKKGVEIPEGVTWQSLDRTVFVPGQDRIGFPGDWLVTLDDGFGPRVIREDDFHALFKKTDSAE